MLFQKWTGVQRKRKAERVKRRKWELGGGRQQTEGLACWRNYTERLALGRSSSEREVNMKDLEVILRAQEMWASLRCSPFSGRRDCSLIVAQFSQSWLIQAIDLLDFSKPGSWALIQRVLDLNSRAWIKILFFLLKVWLWEDATLLL